MISLHSDSLVFETTAGDLIPCSVESVVVEMVGDGASAIDPSMLRQAAAAILHYFRSEKQKTHVTVGEFAEALARVLRSFGIDVQPNDSELSPKGGSPTPSVTSPPPRPAAAELDLARLTQEPGEASELFFFPRLRAAMRDRLATSPTIVRCSGIQRCVKRLAGVRRWSPRCQKLQDQILDYLRSCLSQEPRSQSCTLVVR